MKFDKVEVSGIAVLFIGVILLVATFYSAFMFLVGDVTILASADLAELFGNALSPLIAAVIHILYLGVMGWMGSVTTIRSVQLLKREKEVTPMQPLPNTQVATKAEPKNEPQRDVKEPVKIDSPQKPSVPQPPVEQAHEPAEKVPEKPIEPTAG